MERLPEEALNHALETLPEWTLANGAIVWRRRFPDFASAATFLMRVALLAEKRDHHPDIKLTYDQLELSLVTHDAKGITQRDIDMASAISGLGSR